MSTQTKNIALIGFGTVGQGFFHYLEENKEDKQLATVVIKNASKSRVPDSLNFSTNVSDVHNNKEITTVVELISDYEQAFSIVKQALLQGKHVVSSNKKMIASHLEELVELEQNSKGTFLYEGAVAGSIPILKIINEQYAFDEITEVRGILNGTSNYILTQIFEKGIDYKEALQQAQEAGFAEANPASDVEGYDALYKLLILTTHAFGKFISPEKALNIGINNIKNSDIVFAKKHKLNIKLVGSIKSANNKLTLSVLPTFVDENDDLYHVKNEYNAVEVVSKNIGSQVYKGKGAGSLPTGHVVYTDFKSVEKTSYSYKNIPSGKRIKYETKDNIWVYSNKITLLEKYLEDVVLLNGPEGYGSIKIADLIKAKDIISVHNLSIIAVNENIRQQLVKQQRKAIFAFA
ncbi:MAG: homoserine dehydrogenase [Flavobacteriales bacterium]